MNLKQIIVLLLLTSCSLSQPNISNKKTMNTTANWSKGLLNITIENVNINSTSLYEAWKNISTDYLVQTILVVTDKTPIELPFEFISSRCRVRDVLDAIAAKYNMHWKQEKQTGIIWFYPIELGFDKILPSKIQVAENHFGLPMQSGIMEPLEKNDSTEIIVKSSGSIFLNTFNYSVNIPANSYTVRDILNMCCISNPTKSFIVEINDGKNFITPVNNVSDKIEEIPLGALNLWDMEIKMDRGKAGPKKNQIIEALAHDDPKIRHSARNYLESIIFSDKTEGLREEGRSIEQKLWTCLGLTSILVRHEEATDIESIKLMKQLATDAFLSTCEPELAIMTALELARLTKDSSYWEVVQKRKINLNELSGISSDTCRIASLSNYVCNMLRTNTNLDFIKDLRSLVTIVQLPKQGELEFKMKSE